MKTIDELIAEFCSNGVETVKVKDAFSRLKGTPITANRMHEIQQPDGNILIFAGGKTVVRANEIDLPEANVIRAPAVLVQSRGIIDFIYCDKPFTFKNEMWAYTADDFDSVKYLYYVFKRSIMFFRNASAGMGAFPQISLKVTENYTIPFPPLAVQKEIVRILDSFTGLIAELEAELSARRKQYEQYRNKLLTFDDNVEWKLLQDVCVIKHGSDYKSFGPGKYPVYGSGGIMTYVDRYAYDKPTVLLPRKGSLDKIHYVDHPFWNVDTVFYTEIDTGKTIPKFMYHYLLTVDLRRWSNVGGVPGLTQSRLNKIAVPHPPLPEQKRIVEILDKFDALCNNEMAGLAAEIAARKKQYEYYRDRLLNFKRKEEGGNVDSPKRKKRNSPRKGGRYYTEDGMKQLKRSGMKGHEAAERLIAEQIGERHRLLRPLTREAASILKSVKGMIPRALFLSNAIVREAERRAKKEKA